MTYTINKGKRILQIIQALRGTWWGAHPHMLLTIYRAMLRASIEYSAHIFGLKHSSLSRSLQVVQNQALRLCYGYHISTPLNIIYAEIELTLSHRIRLLTSRYFLKISSVNGHIVINKLFLFCDTVIGSHKTRAGIIYATLTMDEMAIRQQIQWSYVEKRFVGYVDHGLVISDPKDLPLAKEASVFLITSNKLNNKHLQWRKNKMNVKLAAQTLSESCAVALEQLQDDKHPDFLNCAATIKFCKMCNNVFNCLNTRSTFANHFKKPLNKSTAANIFEFFTEAIHYFSNIKLTKHGPLITISKAKTGFLGFILNMINLKNMFYEYVETNYLQYILSYKLSQDHLEIFFSCIRSIGGYNNNPTYVQFSSAYKRLLHHNEVKSSAQANCIAISNISILMMSSSSKKLCMT
ncbi:THAP domain-containing protein 9 [Trachymyrmex cornetzi]|uniref:THAP domain-containing protein 9 n=1 Tax=Trachymyrmex cornetzi TaxID=471704 RepID=A0A151IU36_9HYME|nr:THAP domain-containing protein 9 [Trachymyrmex cornetzi]